jgi:DNA-binding CsgD family transcriptional regulator
LNSSAAALRATTLRELAGADGYLIGVLGVAARIGRAADFAELVELLHEAVARLGASAAYFATFVRQDEGFGPRRLLLACDAPSTLEHDRAVCLDSDPWLDYAARHPTPARECELARLMSAERAISEPVGRSCFQSAVCIPTPVSSRSGRVGALVVGSRTPSFFDDDGYPAFKIAARLVAIELNDRSVELMRDELLSEVALTRDDLRLLRYVSDGMTTKAIARASGWSGLAIDTRFKRMLPKFHVHSRSAAARLAADYRII